MHAEDQHAPSLLEQAAQQAATHTARAVAQQALVKLGAILGAKAGAVVAVVLAVVILVVLLIILIVSVAGAAFQSSTAVWPVPIATDSAGAYTASGWAISSRFGWRDDPRGGGAEFHDGIDLTNPQGRCPFGYHCGTPAMFDGQVKYVGWDMAASGDPSKTGGGEIVILRNGDDDHETLYAHLEPYRLYVRLEGKIKDSYDRDAYRRYQEYQPIGQGALKPDLSNGSIEMRCQNDMPNFIATRTGGGSVLFLYDRPATCTTTVVWGQRGGDWKGWLPDEPDHQWGDSQRAELSWQTPIELGKQAKDVALRFRAHLVPPDPPPSPTVVPTTASVTARHAVVAASGAAIVQPGQGSSVAHPPEQDGGPEPAATPGAVARDGRPAGCERISGGWMRCTWMLADIPTEQERFALQPDSWIVAAQSEAATTDGVLRHQRDADMVTAPSTQLSPTPSASPAPVVRTPPPTPTAVPTVSRALDVQASTRGMGGPAQGQRALQATADTMVSRATLSPADRQWLTAGSSATWALHLANNQRGNWSILIAASDPRLVLSTDAACSVVDDTGRLCVLPGSATILQISVAAGEDVGGLTADIPITVMDTDQRAGVVVNYLRLLLGVGMAPTATPTASGSPTPVILPTPPSMPTAGPGGGDGGGGGLDCAPQPLVQLPNVVAPQPRLIAPAAASFAAVRQEIVDRTGSDALAVLGDVLRAPSFSTDKPGVLSTSWHKAGRAVDLNQGGPFVRVAEGSRFRLYMGNVDITAIFEAHGWNRIPVQGETLEWWHYEWHPDGIAWTSAMLQVWELPTLQSAFPTIDWPAIGCAGGSASGGDLGVSPQDREQLCILGSPSFGSTVEYFDGCGPPVRVGDAVYQLDSRLGYVGLTGSTTGPHLHLGLKIKSYNGSWPSVDICTPEELDGRAPPDNANCWTEMADPLAFLPRAPGSIASGGVVQANAVSVAALNTTPTAIIPEGAPYQLPPPNYPNSLLFTPVPDATPVGQYWSPYADGGQYGGGGVGEWFCMVWGGWPWCG